MKYFFIFIIVFFVGFSLGSYKEKYYFEKYVNAEKENTINQLSELLKKERTAKNEIEKISVERMQKISDLDKFNNALRLQFKALHNKHNRALSSSDSRSNVASQCECGRTREMVPILERATELIKERDRIAIDYNTLYKQCGVANGSHK